MRGVFVFVNVIGFFEHLFQSRDIAEDKIGIELFTYFYQKEVLQRSIVELIFDFSA